MYSSIMSWVKQPFSEQQDLLHWALFTILIVTIVVAWTRVLATISE